MTKRPDTHISLTDEKKSRENTSSGRDIPRKTVVDLCAGEHEAFNEIFRSYHASIKQFLTVLLRSEYDAEDIAQRVFITLWEKRETIDPDKNIKYFLYRIARNDAMNYFDKKKVEEKYLQFSERCREFNDGPDDIVIAKELEILVEIALRRMPEQRRKAYLMRRKKDMSLDEVAEELGISKFTVKNHIQNAERDIREIIVLTILLFMS